MKRIYLNIIAIIFYFSITIGFGYMPMVDKLMFWAKDAQTFRDYLPDKVPFLWPMILNIFNQGGPWLVWYLQFILWTSSFNLIMSSVRVKWAAVIFIGLNVSMILLTFHAVSETFVIFLVSLMVYAHSRKQDKYILPIMALLAVIKPVFIFPLIFVAGYYLWRKWDLKILFIPTTILMVQIIIGLHFTGSMFPTITADTFRQYFFAAVYADVHDISVKDAQLLVKQFTGTPMIYCLSHPLSLVTVYLNYFVHNTIVASNFAFQSILRSVTLFTNYILFGLVMGNLWRVKWRKNIPLVILAGWVILTAPVSFSQGDRLVISIVPILVYLISECEK